LSSTENIAQISRQATRLALLDLTRWCARHLHDGKSERNAG